MTGVCVYVCMSVPAWLVYITGQPQPTALLWLPMPVILQWCDHFLDLPLLATGGGSNESCQTLCLDVCCSMYTCMCMDACTNVRSYVCMCVSMQKEQSDKLRANLQYTKEEAYDSAIKYVCMHVHTHTQMV